MARPIYMNRHARVDYPHTPISGIIHPRTDFHKENIGPIGDSTLRDLERLMGQATSQNSYGARLGKDGEKIYDKLKAYLQGIQPRPNNTYQVRISFKSTNGAQKSKDSKSNYKYRRGKNIIINLPSGDQLQINRTGDNPPQLGFPFRYWSKHKPYNLDRKNVKETNSSLDDSLQLGLPFEAYVKLPSNNSQNVKDPLAYRVFGTLIGIYQKFGGDPAKIFDFYEKLGGYPAKLPKAIKYGVLAAEIENPKIKSESSYKPWQRIGPAAIAFSLGAVLAYDALRPAIVSAEEKTTVEQKQGANNGKGLSGLYKSITDLDIYEIEFTLDNDGINYVLKLGGKEAKPIFISEPRGFIKYEQVPRIVSIYNYDQKNRALGKIFWDKVYPSVDLKYMVAEDILKEYYLTRHAEASLIEAKELSQKGALEASIPLFDESYSVLKIIGEFLPQYVMDKIDQEFLRQRIAYSKPLNIRFVGEHTPKHASAKSVAQTQSTPLEERVRKFKFVSDKGMINVEVYDDGTAYYENEHVKDNMDIDKPKNAREAAIAANVKGQRLLEEEVKAQQAKEKLRHLFLDIARNFRIGVSGNYEDKKGVFNANIETLATIYDSENKVLNLQLFGSLGTQTDGHSSYAYDFAPVAKYKTEDGTIYSLGFALQFLRKLGYDRGTLEFEQMSVAFEIDKQNNSFYLNFGLPLSNEQIASRKLISSSSSTSTQDLGDKVREITKKTNRIKEIVLEAVPYLDAIYRYWLKQPQKEEVGVRLGGGFEWLGGAGNIKPKYKIGPEILLRSGKFDTTLEASVNLRHPKEDFFVGFRIDYVLGRELTEGTVTIHQLKDPIKFRRPPIVEYTREKEHVEETSQDFNKIGGTISANPTSGVAPLTVKYTVKDLTGKTPFKLTYKPGGGVADKTIEASSTTDTQEFTYNKSGTVSLELIIKDALEQTKTLTGPNVTVSAAAVLPTLDSIGNKTGNENSLLEFIISCLNCDSTSASNLPSGATYTPSTKTFSWTPNFAQSGSYSVTFTATNSAGTDSETITITVNNVNVTITISPSSNQNIDAGDFINWQSTPSHSGTIAWNTTTLAGACATIANVEDPGPTTYDNAGTCDINATLTVSGGVTATSPTIRITVGGGGG